MSPYDGAKLTFSADLDGDGSDEQLAFVMRSGITIELGTLNSPLVDQAFSRYNSVIGDWLDNEDGSGSRRQGFTIDLGAGQHYCEIAFENFEGSNAQWGTGDGDAVTDATGEDVRTQMSLLDRALQVTTIDSRSPATLHVAEYADSGRWDPLDVVVVDPNAVWDVDESSSVFQSSIRFVEAASLNNPVDGRNQRE